MTRTVDKLRKHYGKLTVDERLRLALAAAKRGDTGELEALSADLKPEQPLEWERHRAASAELNARIKRLRQALRDRVSIPEVQEWWAQASPADMIAFLPTQGEVLAALFDDELCETLAQDLETCKPGEGRWTVSDVRQRVQELERTAKAKVHKGLLVVHRSDDGQTYTRSGNPDEVLTREDVDKLGEDYSAVIVVVRADAKPES